MQNYFPDQLEQNPEIIGDIRLKLSLSFQSIQALFAKLMIDIELPRDAKKRLTGQYSRQIYS